MAIAINGPTALKSKRISCTDFPPGNRCDASRSAGAGSSYVVVVGNGGSHWPMAGTVRPGGPVPWPAGDRKSLRQGKSVYVRVGIGGRRILETQQHQINTQ